MSLAPRFTPETCDICGHSRDEHETVYTNNGQELLAAYCNAEDDAGECRCRGFRDKETRFRGV